MDSDAYAKQLESHIEKLNLVIDKLLKEHVNESKVYYVVPKGNHIFSLNDNKRYYKSIQEAFLLHSHIGTPDDIPVNYVKAEDDYASRHLVGFRKILDICSMDLITGEIEKVIS